jgi:hypothetical protein
VVARACQEWTDEGDQSAGRGRYWLILSFRTECDIWGLSALISPSPISPDRQRSKAWPARRPNGRVGSRRPLPRTQENVELQVDWRSLIPTISARRALVSSSNMSRAASRRPRRCCRRRPGRAARGLFGHDRDRLLRDNGLLDLGVPVQHPSTIRLGAQGGLDPGPGPIRLPACELLVDRLPGSYRSGRSARAPAAGPEQDAVAALRPNSAGSKVTRNSRARRRA